MNTSLKRWLRTDLAYTWCVQSIRFDSRLGLTGWPLTLGIKIPGIFHFFQAYFSWCSRLNCCFKTLKPNKVIRSYYFDWWLNSFPCNYCAFKQILEQRSFLKDYFIRRKRIIVSHSRFYKGSVHLLLSLLLLKMIRKHW